MNDIMEPYNWTVPEFKWATPEQNIEIAEYVTSVFNSFANIVDKWMEREVLPHTVNANIDYGMTPVEKRETHF